MAIRRARCGLVQATCGASNCLSNMMARAAGLLLMTILVVAPQVALGNSQPAWALPPLCDTIDFNADEGRCTPGGCALLGNALITCGPLRLRAHVLRVGLGHSGYFDGAQALGQVRLDDGARAIACEALMLGADKISAIIDHGLLRVRRQPSCAAAAQVGEPAGPWALTVTGDMVRDGAGVVQASNSTLTLCDCGPGRPPSWQLAAPQVRVVPGARATVYWPQLKISFFGLPLVPVTPPLLPISLPLTPRALGLLVPQVTFLGPPLPTVDVPMFIPLGPSWDITLTPGVRGDWAFAPRLAVRVRGAPSAWQALTVDARTTIDLHHRAAARYAAMGAKAGSALTQSPAWQAQLRERQALVWRTRVDAQHRLAVWRPGRPHAGQPAASGTAALEWQSTLAWVSDDAVLADLGVRAQDRVAAYLPSRTAWVLRHPQFVAQVGADAMLRLDSVAALQDGTAAAVLSNLGPLERQTLHRMPYGGVRVLQGPSLGPLRLKGQVTWARYGALGPRAKNALPTVQRSQMGTRGEVTLEAAQALGPWRTRAAVSLDGVAFATEGAGALVDGVVVVDGFVKLPVWRRWATTQHVLAPLLRYRALLRPSPEALRLFVAGADALDPYLQREAVHQIWAGLGQSFTPRAPLPGSNGAPLHLTLDIGQPFDLLKGRLAQPSGRLTVRWGSLLRSETLVGAAWRGPGPRVQHLSQQLALTHRRFGMWGHYLRAAPGAERFLRSVYALSAVNSTATDVGGAAWAHALQMGGEVNPGPGLRVRSAVSFALPKPSLGLGGKTLWTTATTQNLELAYTSPCACWGAVATISAAPQNLRQSWRMQVLLTVADTRLGN